MIELNEIYTMRTKPRKCPNCGSRKVCSVQGGTFNDTDQISNGIDESGVLLKWGWFDGRLPSWECRYCGLEIHKESDFEIMTLF